MKVYNQPSLFLLLLAHHNHIHTCTHTTGVIVGYVGGSHIPAGKKESHARMLMSGTRWWCITVGGWVGEKEWAGVYRPCSHTAIIMRRVWTSRAYTHTYPSYLFPCFSLTSITLIESLLALPHHIPTPQAPSRTTSAGPSWWWRSSATSPPSWRYVCV